MRFFGGLPLISHRHWIVLLVELNALSFLVWIGLSRLMVRYSRRQDETGDVRFTAKNVRVGAISLVAFAVTFCMTSFDWIMLLEPHWYSTVFG